MAGLRFPVHKDLDRHGQRWLWGCAHEESLTVAARSHKKGRAVPPKARGKPDGNNGTARPGATARPPGWTSTGTDMSVPSSPRSRDFVTGTAPPSLRPTVAQELQSLLLLHLSARRRERANPDLEAARFVGLVTQSTGRPARTPRPVPRAGSGQQGSAFESVIERAQISKLVFASRL